MSALLAAAKTLRTELKALSADGIRNVAYGVPASPPCTVVGPPVPSYEVYGAPVATSATFVVYLVVTMNEEAVERLLTALPKVVEAIEGVDDATVDDVQPTVYRDPSGTELPCYMITVSMALSE